MSTDPLAFFITWTVYGTFLPGDLRGWTARNQGKQAPRPQLAVWHRDRLKHSIELLTEINRQCLAKAILEFGDEKGWKVWVANPRSNHVHVVVSAVGYSGGIVRDQLKARCTRELRKIEMRFCDRPVWTRGGDWQPLFNEDALEDCVIYASEAQDRKDRDR